MLPFPERKKKNLLILGILAFHSERFGWEAEHGAIGCKHSTWEAPAGGLLWVPGKPGSQNVTWSQDVKSRTFGKNILISSQAYIKQRFLKHPNILHSIILKKKLNSESLVKMLIYVKIFLIQNLNLTEENNFQFVPSCFEFSSEKNVKDLEFLKWFFINNIFKDL